MLFDQSRQEIDNFIEAERYKTQSKTQGWTGRTSSNNFAHGELKM